MAQNVLLAVGGTGARVVESLVPLLAAGLGPTDLVVGFIDQDANNGNVIRAIERLEHYQAVRDTCSTPSVRLQWAGKEGTQFASTRVTGLVEDWLWCPHPDADSSLYDIYERQSMEEGSGEGELMDMLFEPGPEEQRLNLTRGYRGKPHIGAAALMQQFLAGSDFIDKLNNVVASSKADEVRVFLVGSVFGGTGAAGFPTIARTLRENQIEGGFLRLGGLLMLPYFSFQEPKGETVFARSEDLLIQSEQALQYYERLFSRNQKDLFNQVYMVGWEPVFRLGYGSTGSESQRNPPLPPDLYGALAALRFLSGNFPAEPRNEVLICGRAKEDALVWGDLPPVADGQREQVREQLGQILRFCAWWRLSLSPQLTKGGSDAGFGRQTVDTRKLEQPAAVAARQALDIFASDVLVWASSMAAFAMQGGLKSFELWRLDRYVEANTSRPNDPVSLPSESMGESAQDLLFASLVGGTRSRTMGEAYSQLIQTPGLPAHEGLGKLIAGAFAQSHLQEAA